VNVYHLDKAAKLAKALADCRYAMKRNSAGTPTHVAVGGMTPFAINFEAGQYTLRALEAYLITELTQLGVTDLENVQ
jgi:hypothetical protein